MRKTLKEVKNLNNAKPKKPKQVDVKEYLALIMAACYRIIREENDFEQFCRKENISQNLAEKLKTFAETQSFLRYISNALFAVVTNPEYTLPIPSGGDAKHYGDTFGLTIVKSLVEDLKIESIESLSSRVDSDMQKFQEMTALKMAQDGVEPITVDLNIK